MAVTAVATATNEESTIVRPNCDAFNYNNAYTFNPEARRFEKYYYNPNPAIEGKYNSYTGRWEPNYSLTDRRYDNDGRWFNPATGRYEYSNTRAGWRNTATGRFEYNNRNRYDDRDRYYNPLTGMYSRRYAASTGRYENDFYDNRRYYNRQTGRFEYNGRNPNDYDDRNRFYNPQAGRFDYDKSRRYNASTGSYESDFYNNRRYYNWQTGRFEYEYVNPYNPYTGRYEQYKNYDRYQSHPNFGRRYANDYYGTGSVEEVHVPKIRYDNEQHYKTLRDVRVADDNGYQYSYETENAIRAAEDAQVVHKGTPHETLTKTGFYEYVGDDSKTYRVDYIADENGFHATVRILFALN